MKFCLGLTGSIGMGKSTTAKMFADQGCVIWDADAAVHRLYGVGGSAVGPLLEKFEDVVVDGAISRARLRDVISADQTALCKIEKIVHPLVQQDRKTFMRAHPDDIGVFDIPLLFETGAESQMDAVACVSVSREIQKKRVLERGTMSEDQFDQILAKQMPNAEKMRRSDYVIETETLEHTRAQVQNVMADIQRRLGHA